MDERVTTSRGKKVTSTNLHNRYDGGGFARFLKEFGKGFSKVQLRKVCIDS